MSVVVQRGIFFSGNYMFFLGFFLVFGLMGAGYFRLFVCCVCLRVEIPTFGGIIFFIFFVFTYLFLWFSGGISYGVSVVGSGRTSPYASCLGSLCWFLECCFVFLFFGEKEYFTLLGFR